MYNMLEENTKTFTGSLRAAGSVNRYYKESTYDKNVKHLQSDIFN